MSINDEDAGMPLTYGIVESVDLAHPKFPQTMDGFRIAHVADLHTDKRTKRLNRMIYQLAKVRLDLGVLAGDYMIKHRRIGQALPYLRELVTQVRPTHGWFGVLGNHDRAELIDQIDDLPVHWLRDEAVRLQDKPIDIIGLHMDGEGNEPDPAAAAMSVGERLFDLPVPQASQNRPGDPRRFRLALTHKPDFIPACSDLGADLVLSGHTHGGQMRLPFGYPLFNSSDLPLSRSAGLNRHRNTLAMISRGVGSTPLLYSPINTRILCPPHVPIYTLRQGSMPGEPTDDIASVWRW